MEIYIACVPLGIASKLTSKALPIYPFVLCAKICFHKFSCASETDFYYSRVQDIIATAK